MPVKRTSLVDQLVSTIQHELITGQYPAGTAFVEEDVKTRYNVSRSTTREALVRLEEDGFLSRDPGTRTLRFRTLTEEEIRDVYYARRFYEGSGINHAKHATEGQLKEISDSATSLWLKSRIPGRIWFPGRSMSISLNCWSRRITGKRRRRCSPILMRVRKSFLIA